MGEGLGRGSSADLPVVLGGGRGWAEAGGNLLAGGRGVVAEGGEGARGR